MGLCGNFTQYSFQTLVKQIPPWIILRMMREESLSTVLASLIAEISIS